MDFVPHSAFPFSVPCSSFRRSRERGLTLIEILVVIALISVVMGLVIAGSHQLPSARLKRSATMIVSAVRVAYMRATSTSKDLRVVFDMDGQKIWIEESDIPMLVQTKDKTGTGGADPITQAEKDAIEAGEKILKGPPVPKPKFHPIAVYGFGDVEGAGGKPLQRGITFREVQTAHDDAPRASGRAYLYFWPGGMTERAEIQIRIGDSADEHSTLTLLVSPLTGKTTIKTGPVALATPTNENEASDREDTGW
jgi:general secretion pathway protein H